MLTQEEIKELFYYCDKTGSLRWKERENKNFWNARYANKIAGCINRDGYMEVRPNNKKHYAIHRLIWIYFYGELPKNGIDHISTIKTENFIHNLREANKSENGQNIRKATKRNKTGFLGVHYSKRTNKFISQITINKINHFLGYFITPEEAYSAYLKAKRELHPFGTL